MDTFSKITHWILFLVMIVIAYTAIMNTTFFSKEAIMSSFDISFQALEIFDVGKADQLFIARLERRIGWTWHFWAGVAASVIVIISFIRNMIIKRKINKGLKVLYTYTTVMLLTGIPLWIRTYYDIPQEQQDIARAIHHYTSYTVAIVFILHIAFMIYKENKEDRPLISNMFRFKNSFIVAAILSSLLAGTTNLKAEEKINHFEIAMAFYKGEKGATIKTMTLPSCPYDFCKNADKMKEKMGVTKENGTEVIQIKKVDLKKALFFFQKSAYEDNNKEALDRALKLVLGELNYKDKTLDSYLVKSLKERLDLTPEEYKVVLKSILSKAEELNTCYTSFKIAQFKEHGYMNIYDKSGSEKEYYKMAARICKKDKYEYVYSLGKIRE